MGSIVEILSLPELVSRASDLCQARFGRAPEWVAAAPGRVNLIGEHIDYNGGSVLPMAIPCYTVLAACPAPASQAGRVRLFSGLLNEEHTFALAPAGRSSSAPWANYVRGVIQGYRQRGLSCGGFDAVIDSTVPLGSGLSSSAALEVATATLVEALSGRSLSRLDKALLCQQAEHEYAGVPCGIMDQFASVFGQLDHLLLVDCRRHRATPIAMRDPSVSVLIANSRVKHQLSATHNPYAERRADCEAAARALGVPLLVEARPQDLFQMADRLPRNVVRRARHVFSEIERTLQAAQAIEAGRWAKFGELMYASHDSLADDFEVSCPELDLLVDLARSLGRDGGVLGARMTGGGFGGCTVNLVATESASAVAEHLSAGYQQQTGILPEIFVTRPAQGAHLVVAGAAQIV